jgi:hypothetical protein
MEGQNATVSRHSSGRVRVCSESRRKRNLARVRRVVRNDGNTDTDTFHLRTRQLLSIGENCHDWVPMSLPASSNDPGLNCLQRKPAPVAGAWLLLTPLTPLS